MSVSEELNLKHVSVPHDITFSLQSREFMYHFTSVFIH